MDGNDLDPDTDMLFPAASDDGHTAGRAVNLGGRAVGDSRPCFVNTPVGPCPSSQDGAQWPPSGTQNTLEAEFDCPGIPSGTQETEHQALGVNDADNIVGSGFEKITCDTIVGTEENPNPPCKGSGCRPCCEVATLCPERALFWENPGESTTPVVLGTIDADVVPFDRQTRAEAVTCPQFMYQLF